MSEPCIVGGSMEQERRVREPENVVWQTRRRPQTGFERALADALERAFLDGVEELDALVARLNADGVRDENHRLWTAESFRAAMARLGAPDGRGEA